MVGRFVSSHRPLDSDALYQGLTLQAAETLYEGHGFSRAVNAIMGYAALAAEVRFSRPIGRIQPVLAAFALNH
jgi:hypothetical protein